MSQPPKLPASPPTPGKLAGPNTGVRDAGSGVGRGRVAATEAGNDKKGAGGAGLVYSVPSNASDYPASASSNSSVQGSIAGSSAAFSESADGTEYPRPGSGRSRRPSDNSRSAPTRHEWRSRDVMIPEPALVSLNSGSGVSSKVAAQMLVWSLRHAAQRIRQGMASGAMTGMYAPSQLAQPFQLPISRRQQPRGCCSRRWCMCCFTSRRCCSCGSPTRRVEASVGPSPPPPPSVFFLYAASTDGIASQLCAAVLAAVWAWGWYDDANGGSDATLLVAAVVILLAVLLNCLLVWRRQAVLGREVVDRVLAAADKFESQVLPGGDTDSVRHAAQHVCCHCVPLE